MKKLLLILSLVVFAAPVMAQQSIKSGGGSVVVGRTGTVTITPRSDKTVALADDTTVAGTLTVSGATTIGGDSALTGTLTQNSVLKQTTTISLSAAQIIAMGTTPVTLVAAPGAGKCTIVNNITLKMVATATAFTGGGALEFRYTDASGTKVTADIAAAVVTAGAGTSFTNVRGIEASLTCTANAAIVIRNPTAAFAAGTGTAVITIDYHVAI